MTGGTKKILVIAGIAGVCVLSLFVYGLVYAARSFARATSGTEVARVAFTSPGNGDATFAAHANEELQLWTQLDVEYASGGHDDLNAVYEVTAEQGGHVLASARCGTADRSVTMMSVRTEWSGDVHERYQGKMRCAIVAPAEGPLVLHAKLSIPEPPAKLAVRDLSLVVKR
jgi:hypothetical protein